MKFGKPAGERLILALLGALILLASPLALPAQTNQLWLNVEIGLIGPASEDILHSALKRCEEKACGGLIVTLDTPGGSLESARKMVQEIMASPVPLIVWVGPDGAHAGSAGAFITLAAHLATMAPGTNIGAAHPVNAGGDDLEPGASSEKIVQDTMSFMASIAETRGRNAEMAVSFVRNSLSITATEALTNDVIDLLAADLDQLFRNAAGKSLIVGGRAWTIPAKKPTIETYEPSLRQKLLAVIAHPDVFYLLFMAGIIGLAFELTHPGVLFPGLAGAISLLLAFMASSVLPVSYGSAALMLAGMAMLIAEIFLPSFGILGIGGLIAFILGSVFLVDPSGIHGLRVSWIMIAPGVLIFIACGLTIAWLVGRTLRSRVQTGAEAMRGRDAEAMSDFIEGEGKVRIDGELWQARAAMPVSRGDRVRVLEVDGLCLNVELIRTQI